MVSLRPMAGNAERQDEQKGRRALRKHLMEAVQGEGRGGTTPLTSRAATDPHQYFMYIPSAADPPSDVGMRATMMLYSSSRCVDVHCTEPSSSSLSTRSWAPP